MRFAGKTDIGCVRNENQDDFRAAYLPEGAVWGIVCDGMGGAKGGREASRIACESVELLFREHYGDCSSGQEDVFLKNGLRDASRFIFQRASESEALSGMGTTAVCTLVRGGVAHLCHVGDSRCYLYREGRLVQLTHDHSYVQELVDCGTITAEEAENHPQKNIITRALGVDFFVVPEYTRVTVREGDILLLCSDGLSNMVSVSRAEEILKREAFYDMPDGLITAAREQGGRDNITALLLSV